MSRKVKDTERASCWSVSCVGENYRPNAWMHRSCQFRHLCFHLKTKEFVLYQSREERAMEEALQEFAFASNSMNSSVAIGGINIKRDQNEMRTVIFVDVSFDV